MKLFAVMLGGRAQGCHIELHDVVFVASPKLEEAYPRLVNKWFGLRERVHIDSSVELSSVDGYEIELQKTPPAAEQTKKLYFVNFGGYQKGFFGELHAIKFYVVDSVKEAIIRAKQELCLSLLQQHCDDSTVVTDVFNEPGMLADDVIEVSRVDGFHIHLHATAKPAKLDVESYYRKLSLPEIGTG